MNRPHRSIEIFTMSALDLFITAMGSFAILMMVLFPYYKGYRHVRSDQPPIPENVTSFSMACAWPTRVRDYEEYVKAGRHPERNAKNGLDDWKNPGYSQLPDHPVVEITSRDAWDFCKWLTEKERAAGILGPHDQYQLLTSDEWSNLAGVGKYPWGDAWPPPKDAGNFGNVAGYADGHPGVAPVGSYPPNRAGLYDMAGNVRQLTSQPGIGIRVTVQGSSWRDAGKQLETATHEDYPEYPNFTPADFVAGKDRGYNYIPEKSDVTGFRVVFESLPAAEACPMNRPARSIEIFTMSALDLFITAMGSFAILMMILFPYYKDDRKKREDERQGIVLFCAWPTRVQDYAQFKKETQEGPEVEVKPEDRKFVFDADSWKEPGYEQEANFPVVMITWLDAQAFCQWLTKKERESKTIGAEDEYRLPTMAEWRSAMGKERYPWGNDWPPPPKYGNLGGEEYSRGRGFSSAPEAMRGYEDDHEMASPVGSYTPSRDGLYDMVGNVQIWTQDDIEGTGDNGEKLRSHNRVGAAWSTNNKTTYECMSADAIDEAGRIQTLGFRCVLVIKTPPKP